MTRPDARSDRQAPAPRDDSAKAHQAPQRAAELVLTEAERRVVARALASAHYALERMPPRLRPNGEAAAISRLLQRVLGENWAALASTVRFRLK
jgi:hypothetical protein